MSWFPVLLAALFASPGCVPGEAEGQALVAGFLVEDGVYNSELAAPLDILHHTPFHTRPGIKVLTVARSTEPITTFEGLKITPDVAYESAPRLDILVVPSAERHVEEGFDDPELIAFVRERAKQARFVMSLCDGAFVLAKAGLLEGRTCTTFPGDIAALRKRYPGARVIDGVSFAVDGKLITSVGGARSYDPALYVVERLYGETPARGVARGLVLDWNVDKVPHYVVEPAGTRAYDVGDLIDPGVTVEDRDGQTLRLLDLPSADDRVIVLYLFGGGGHEGDNRRGGIWCEDSANDLPLLRHMLVRYAEQPVAFVPVSCPPVHHETTFGHPEGAFDPGSERFTAERGRFVAATERAVAEKVIPFETLYYDSTFRLMRSEVDESQQESWAGRFRARGEWQTYGTPTIWILSRTGEVLMPPFHGNNHEKDVVLRYTARELTVALDRALKVTEGE